MHYSKGFILKVEGKEMKIKLSDGVKLYKVLEIDEKSDKGTYYIVVKNEEYEVGEEEIRRVQNLLKDSQMEFNIKKRYKVSYIERHFNGYSYLPLILFNESEIFITDYEYINIQTGQPKKYGLVYCNKEYEISETVFNFIKENILKK